MTTQTTEYLVTYSVLADSRLQAIMKAGAMLRSAVRVVGEAEAEQGIPGWWDVTFLLSEEYEPFPEQADPVTMAKAEAARDEPWWVGRRDRDQLTGAYNPESERQDPLTGEWH